MAALFEKTQINGMTLPNRFVRSATWSGMATKQGACTQKLVNLMTSLAQGGVGVIITGHAYVRQDGQAGPNQLGVYSDELLPGLRGMVRTVHDNGGKIVLQLAHAGFFANAKLTGKTPLAPSAIEGLAKSPRREMTHQDIREVIQAFGNAAMRAKEAGFDGVQIHAAHGYLLSQFLSPLLNIRTDEYGGEIHNRARALVETLQAIRGAVGRDYPVLVKMNSGDFMEGGLVVEDSAQIGRMLKEQGIDAIELSGGLPMARESGSIRRGITSEDREAYFEDEARAFKKVLSVPLILVGGIRSFQVAERLVEDGVCDYVSMSRPFIREPNLINRWRSGDLRKSTCISENSCLTAAGAGEGIYCVTEKKQQRT
ncbi:MAG: NADH:flavin oxidoreductase [Deltaproteobacteria bacterium]|nr:NADH:flavin oxidoreductase [Deltaproteobacteria bacterium]MBW2078226.1 NADH:flavin oxidoreductase [Deltaproteobacteria bacterium]